MLVFQLLATTYLKNFERTTHFFPQKEKKNGLGRLF
jgi:hypothetical protein